MKIVLCSTCTSTPISSMCCSRSATFVISLASCGVVIVRPASRDSPSSCSLEYAGKRKPRTLPSMSQYCSRVSPGTSTGCGRYFASAGSMYSHVAAVSTTCASASITIVFAGAVMPRPPRAGPAARGTRLTERRQHARHVAGQQLRHGQPQPREHRALDHPVGIRLHPHVLVAAQPEPVNHPVVHSPHDVFAHARAPIRLLLVVQIVRCAAGRDLHHELRRPVNELVAADVGPVRLFSK